METKHFGFVPPVKDVNDKHFGAFNSLPKIVRNPSRDWSKYLPIYEKQYGSGWDSAGCTVFGTLNGYETILKLLEQVEYNFSERYHYNLINLMPPGADPKKVAQSIRDNGVLLQDELPFVDNLGEFRKPRPVPNDLIKKGKKWLDKYDFRYEWLFEDSKDPTKGVAIIKDALQYGPIGVSVTAWIKDGEEYVSRGLSNTHWCLAFKVDEKDRVHVFDSYDQSIKILSKDHDIGYAMRYHVDTMKENIEKLSIMSKTLILLKDLLNAIFTKNDLEEPVKENKMPPTNDLELMCEAIKKHEGWFKGSRSYKNNNPGNLKKAEWKLATGYDKDGFAIFKTEADGMKTLQNMIKNAALGKSSVYKKTDSLVNFFKKYAPSSDNNNPDHYASVVAKHMGVNPFTFKLEDLTLT